MKNIIMMLKILIVCSFVLPEVAVAYDVLFHEILHDTVSMYEISGPDSELTNIGKGIFPQRSPNKMFLSFIHLNELVGREYSSGNPGFLVLKNLQKEKSFKVIRNGQIEFVACYCWQPESKSIAYISLEGPSKRDGYLYIYDLADDTSRKIFHFQYLRFDGAMFGTKLQWSPDGKFLLFSCVSEGENGGAVKLINPADGDVTILSEKGWLPNFIDNKRILFVSGSEVMTIRRNGRRQKKIIDVGVPILNSSRIADNKIVFQVRTKDENLPVPLALYLLDIGREKITIIDVDDYSFLSPVISPDGTKMTAIGFKSGPKNSELGYYLYDFSTHDYTLLKKLQDDKSQGFWWSLYSGYGNGTSWN